jgi:uncharacterized protein (TIRG00374 family)
MKTETPAADDLRSTTSFAPEETAGYVPPRDEIPDGDVPESIGKRIMQPRTFISFGIAALIVLFLFRGLGIEIKEVWSQMRSADPLLYAAAFLTFYSAIVVRAVRWRMMLRQAGISEANGYRLPGVADTTQIMILSLFVNCVVPARLGDAYRSFLLKERNAASFGVSFGTILAERLIDIAVMVGVVLAAGAVVFGTNVPGRAEQAFLLGLGVVVIGVIGVLVLFRLRTRIETWIPDRFTSHFRKLNEGIFTILTRPLPYVALGAVIWLFDGLRVYLVARSLGAELSIPEAIVVSLLSALVTIIPFTPAGVGFVEGFMIWILPQLGVERSTAVAIALLDRSITFLSLIVIGLPLYFWNLRKAAKLVKLERSRNEPVEPVPGA